MPSMQFWKPKVQLTSRSAENQLESHRIINKYVQDLSDLEASVRRLGRLRQYKLLQRYKSRLLILIHGVTMVYNVKRYSKKRSLTFLEGEIPLSSACFAIVGSCSRIEDT